MNSFLNPKDILSCHYKYFFDLPNLFDFIIETSDFDLLFWRRLISYLLLNDTDLLCRIEKGRIIDPLVFQEIKSEIQRDFKSVLKHVGKLKSIPYQTYETCKLAVSKSNLALQYVRQQREQRILTDEELEEICISAVRKNVHAMKFVENRTHKICKVAVETSGHALQYVPFNCGYQDNPELFVELCEIALRNEPNSLKYVVRENLGNLDIDVQLYCYLCKIALMKNGSTLKYVIIHPNLSLDMYYKLCRYAIENQPLALEYVKFYPTEVDTYINLARLAVSLSGISLQFFTKSLSINSNVMQQYIEICKIAINNEPQALKYVRYRNAELRKLAVSKDGMTLEFIPRSEQTLELCRIAVDQNSLAFEFAFDKYRKMLSASMQ